MKKYMLVAFLAVSASAHPMDQDDPTQEESDEEQSVRADLNSFCQTSGHFFTSNAVKVGGLLGLGQIAAQAPGYAALLKKTAQDSMDAVAQVFEPDEELENNSSLSEGVSETSSPVVTPSQDETELEGLRLKVASLEEQLKQKQMTEDSRYARWLSQQPDS